MTGIMAQHLDKSDIEELFSPIAIREQCNKVYELVKSGDSKYFELKEENLHNVAEYILSLIKRDYQSYSYVPAHGRWRSFEIKDKEGKSSQRDLISEHISEWSMAGVDKHECARRVLDFFVVSVLLDAGAGSQWTFRDEQIKQSLKRTEGLGIASLRMFEAGSFSSDKTSPFQVDARGLLNLSVQDLKKGFQVSKENPLIGAENRVFLLNSLGRVLEKDNVFFKSKSNGLKRPGNMLDYLMDNSTGSNHSEIDVKVLWNVIIKGFRDVWPPSRTMVNGISLGDTWNCEILSNVKKTKENQFSKLRF
ncbi:hypothetical protein BB560_002100 [Smittium megazygosporum]|uniref:DUF1688 domain-containing protein n=1 Tax=Smittium megazygosporum TaxID=133381 RepID=A0A2T9ZFQ3_9FUNG|nr:hypothetical protein BB560_002100 [Smittium megazygosporum]